MDPSTIPTSQPSFQSNVPPQNSHTNQPPPPPAPTVANEKRQRKPLAIVDPTTHEAVQISTTTTSTASSSTTTTTTTTATGNSSTTSATSDTRPSETTTDSTTTDSKSANDLTKIQKQADFRLQFGKAMSENSNVSAKKSNDDPPGAAPTKQSSQKSSSETLPVQSTSSASSSRSGSMSRPKSPVVDPPAQVYPGIRTGTLSDEKTTDDKRERSDSQKQTEIEPIDDSKSTVREEEKKTFSHISMSIMTHSLNEKETALGYVCFFSSSSFFRSFFPPHYFNA